MRCTSQSGTVGNLGLDAVSDLELVHAGGSQFLPAAPAVFMAHVFVLQDALLVDRAFRAHAAHARRPIGQAFRERLPNGLLGKVAVFFEQEPDVVGAQLAAFMARAKT